MNKYLKRCSTSLITRQVHIKATVKYQFEWLRLKKKIHVTTHWRVCETDILFTIGGNVNWDIHVGKHFGIIY